jgi:Putative DNA-binding domain
LPEKSEMIDKHFDQVTAADITQLTAEGIYESQLVEFKRDLPGERGRPDPWPTGGDFTAYARDHSLREVIAFANAQGGTVIVGIDETPDDPPRAAVICPISRIHDLATRMQNAARACIDPVLAGLRIRGIEVGGAAGEGVLLCRTGPSPAGPHRVASEGHAYIRRGASSVKMTMREIQDLTIDLLRGVDRLESVFLQREAAFRESLEFVNTEHGACRITAVPLGAFPAIPRLSGPTDFPIRTHFRVNYGADLDLAGPSTDRFRQIVRGFRWSKDDNSVRYEVYESGLVDLWYRHPPADRIRVHFSIGWLLAAYLSVLDAVDTARTMASVPQWEFALEFVLDGVTGAPRHGGGKVPLGALAIGAVNEPRELGRIEELPVRFPRIPYRSRTDRETVLNLVWADMVDAMGGPRSDGAIKLL